MGGRKRKLGVERKSQAAQQRQFFAQRREERERQAAGKAEARKCTTPTRHFNPEIEPNENGRSPPAFAAGRDIEALNPIKKAASGVIQMHSVAAPIHDFTNLGDSNISSAFTPTFERRLSDRHSDLPRVAPSSTATEGEVLRTYLKDSFGERELFQAVAGAAQDDIITCSSSEDCLANDQTERDFEKHSAHSNLKHKRKRAAVSPDGACPMNRTAKENARPSFGLWEKEVSLQMPSVDEKGLDKAMYSVEGSISHQTASPTSHLKVEAPKLENSSLALNLLLSGDSKEAYAEPADLPKRTCRAPLIDSDGFNASVEQFEADLFIVPESDVRTFCHGPCFRRKTQAAPDEEQLDRQWKSAESFDERPVCDPAEDSNIADDSKNIFRHQQCAVVDPVVTRESSVKQTPLNSDFHDKEAGYAGHRIFTPLYNPISAATEAGPQIRSQKNSFVRGTSVVIEPLKPLLPSVTELLIGDRVMRSA